MKTSALHRAVVSALVGGSLALPALAAGEIGADEARAIAKDAYIYGYPVVDAYRTIYTYFVDQNDPNYKGPFNAIRSRSPILPPEVISTFPPNSNTAYSFVALDLRTEPIVVTMPAIEKGRYYSVQFVDGYKKSFAYLDTRTAGNEGGSYLIAGANWKGPTPKRTKKVLQSETPMGWVIFRTQFFAPTDLDNVKKIQAGYKIQPLSAFIGHFARAAAPEIVFPKPLSADEQRTSLAFFSELNFWLQFYPAHQSEKGLMARFAKLEIGAGRIFDADRLSPEIKQAIADGMADAWRAYADLKTQSIDTGRVTAGDMFDSRDINYLYRMAIVVLGGDGNSESEAIYRWYDAEPNSQPLDASTYR